MTEMFADLLPEAKSTAERVAVVEAALEGGGGELVRQGIASWIPQLLPVEVLVPAVYAQWRPLVQDAMGFMLSRLSAARLAPKLVEQIALPSDTAPEVRLLHLIAKMPGLQKLGQVLARNRHLHPALRDELSKLENGISDVGVDEVQSVILEELGPQLKTYAVEIEPAIFCEASVSAVVRFTWRNPGSGGRDRGVFKILKPHIPLCFAEDMELLRELAEFVESKHRDYGLAARVLPDTFNEVRRLLHFELDFLREQETLLKASRLYSSVAEVRVPGLIRPLCTSRITAITEEEGERVTDAVAGMPISSRKRVAEQLIEALIAIPLLAPEGEVMFHADPHAGNLLYDRRTKQLVILDWALTERLSHDQRRQLALLFLMMALRDTAGTCRQIEALQDCATAGQDAKAQLISECVTGFMDQLSFTCIPTSLDAMRLLDRLALAGVQFPAPLIMWRKVLFTLDGILHEIAGPDFSLDMVLLRQLVQSWMANPQAFGSPLLPADWIGMQLSALFYGSRVWTQWARAVSLY